MVTRCVCSTRRMRRIPASFAALAVLGQPVQAQTGSKVVDNEVLSRARPGLDPTGLRLGGFTLFPSIAGSAGYSDNIYNVPSGERKSAMLSVAPQIALRSNWAIHRLDLDVRALIERFPSVPTENNNQYQGALSGRLDITRTLTVEGYGHAIRAVEAL